MKFMKKILFPFLICGSIVAVSTLVESCYYDNEEKLYPVTPTTTCDTASAKFAAFMSPLMTAQCATSNCHSASRQIGGVNLSSYTAIKNYITSNKVTFLGTIKHTAGYSAMPDGGAKLSDCNITKIETWIKNGLLNN